jgi:hypothetical protein
MFPSSSRDVVLLPFRWMVKRHHKLLSFQTIWFFQEYPAINLEVVYERDLFDVNNISLIKRSKPLYRSVFLIRKS